MRKGFTMIELIFVIVILGILAAVAIPRLAATRDDAEISKTATNIQTLVSDLGSYYTSQGKFATKTTSSGTTTTTNNIDMVAMTNVANPVKAKADNCFEVIGPSATSGALEVSVGTAGLCNDIWKLPGLKNINDSLTTDNGKKYLKFGGIGVKYE